jgi:hypothetical protein
MMVKVLDYHENTRVITGKYEQGWMDILAILTTIHILVSLRGSVVIMVRSMHYAISAIYHQQRVLSISTLEYDDSGSVLSEEVVSKIPGTKKGQV